MKREIDIQNKISELNDELILYKESLKSEPSNDDFKYDIDYIKHHIQHLKWVLRDESIKQYRSYKLKINTILHTKNSSMVGNAIITNCIGDTFNIKTDYGNTIQGLTEGEIFSMFNVAWVNYDKDIDGYSCEEIQEKFSLNHKHRV